VKRPSPFPSAHPFEAANCIGGGPKFVRLSRGRIAYREADLEEWIAKRVVSNTSEALTNGDKK
jgi:hypothetical protein